MVQQVNQNSIRKTSKAYYKYQIVYEGIEAYGTTF